MKVSLQFLRRLYDWLLILFPRGYRDEYGEELQTVFNLSLDDAMRKGALVVVTMVFRELIGLPSAMLHEHLRERRNSKMIKNNFNSHSDFLIGSRSEPFAFLIPFLVTLGSFYLSTSLPPMLGSILRLSFLGFMFIVLVAGLSKGLPRWFMPYLGFVLSIVNLFVTNGLIDPKWRGFSFPAYVPRFARDFIQGGGFWVGIIILVLLIVVLATLLPTFRPFYWRLRDDWTLLAFILYGIAPFAIWLTFDDYQNAGSYLFISFLILAIGGWLYLRSSTSLKKYMFLFMGLTLAMAVTAAGAAVLYESTPYHSTWQTLMMEVIYIWTWIALSMLVPLAFSLLSRNKNQVLTSSEV